MRELSLHILDILQNSIAAGASRIVVRVEADEEFDRLVIRIEDNGRGMEPEVATRVLDPFVTSRTTRKVGLGIPMLAATADMCDGHMSIDSKPGKGTIVESSFRLSHIDRAPFGDIGSTMVNTIISYPEISFRYEHSVNGKQFALDTNEMRAQLGSVPLADPAVVRWMRDYLNENIARVGEIDG